jgi:hypothetical protein
MKIKDMAEREGFEPLNLRKCLRLQHLSCNPLRYQGLMLVANFSGFSKVRVVRFLK